MASVFFKTFKYSPEGTTWRLLHAVSQRWFLTSSCPHHGQGNTCDICGNHYYRQFFNETVGKVSEGASPYVPGPAPPLCRSFPVLQGRQQCRGPVWVTEVMAEHQTTHEVCELLSQPHMKDVVPLSIALRFLIKHGWSVLSCKAGHAGWNMVPKIWQGFVSGDISGSVQYKPSRAHYNARSGSSGPPLHECLVSSRTEIPPPFCHLSQGCTALKESFILTSKSFCNLCPFCRIFCPAAGHLWEESGFTFPVMPYRQWETVTRPLLTCLLSMLSKICFAVLSQEHLFNTIKNKLTSSQELAAGNVRAGRIFLRRYNAVCWLEVTMASFQWQQ